MPSWRRLRSSARQLLTSDFFGTVSASGCTLEVSCDLWKMARKNIAEKYGFILAAVHGFAYNKRTVLKK